MTGQELHHKTPQNALQGSGHKLDKQDTKMAYKWVERLIRKTVINPSTPSQRGGVKRAANRIVAKINSAASCVRNEGSQPTIEEIEAELGKGGTNDH